MKNGQEEKAVKGTVRRKIKVLPDMMELFQNNLTAEEDYKKNKVICAFATANGHCTLGFAESKKARPKSLIKGNELGDSRPVDLILKKKSGILKFNEIVVGDKNMIEKYKNHIIELVADEILGETK